MKCMRYDILVAYCHRIKDETLQNKAVTILFTIRLFHFNSLTSATCLGTCSVS